MLNDVDTRWFSLVVIRTVQAVQDTAVCGIGAEGLIY
jgi:hypothetical protein